MSPSETNEGRYRCCGMLALVVMLLLPATPAILTTVEEMGAVQPGNTGIRLYLLSPGPFVREKND